MVKRQQYINNLVIEYLEANPKKSSNDILCDIADHSFGITYRLLRNAIHRLFDSGRITCDVDGNYSIKESEAQNV